MPSADDLALKPDRRDGLGIGEGVYGLAVTLGEPAYPHLGRGASQGTGDNGEIQGRLGRMRVLMWDKSDGGQGVFLGAGISNGRSGDGGDRRWRRTLDGSDLGLLIGVGCGTTSGHDGGLRYGGGGRLWLRSYSG